MNVNICIIEHKWEAVHLLTTADEATLLGAMAMMNSVRRNVRTATVEPPPLWLRHCNKDNI